jgi:uncharacterized Fe-S radical SAM superfamily protein PflX
LIFFQRISEETMARTVYRTDRNERMDLSVYIARSDNGHCAVCRRKSSQNKQRKSGGSKLRGNSDVQKTD